MFAIVFFISILLTSWNAPSVQAIYDPLSVPNNKYGIHVADVNDIRDTTALINSTNGDWGYVTVVIEDKDRNQGKWQEIFNLMRRKHLIPILRLATHPEGDSWKIPTKDDADKWVAFLNSLNWPIQNRYITLFNEPNHSQEWGYTIDPEGYADIAYTYATKFKKASPDFFILPGGLDMSASTDGEALNAKDYLKRMVESKPELFDIIDGWTSHSYPNPAFSASPYATGKGTIQSFMWEIAYLKTLGVKKELPIFITETGWTHNQGKYSRGSLSPETVGDYLIIASQSIWQHKQIVAITPFVFSYQGAPFDHFSWKKLNSSEFYPQYADYQRITKVKGEPLQYEAYTFKNPLIPDQLVTSSTYTLTAEITNKGQGILDAQGYELSIDGLTDAFQYVIDPLPTLEPGETGLISIHLKTPAEEKAYDISVTLRHNRKDIVIEKKTLSLIPPPNIAMTMQFGWKKTASPKGVKILIYDSLDQLLHKFTDLSVENNTLTITGLHNMIPGRAYRIVVVAPYYLPRQQLVTLGDSTTTISIRRFFPFDLNNDGALTFFDVLFLFITKPLDVIGRCF